MKILSLISISMITIIFSTGATASDDLIFKSNNGETITLFTGWNVKGNLKIKVITEDNKNCAELWFTGITNTDLGIKCGTFTIPYNINVLSKSSLRAGNFGSPAIILMHDDFNGLSSSTLWSSSWIATFENANEKYRKCGTNLSCWTQ